MTSENFVKLMLRLRASYPQTVADGQHWKAMVSRYLEELGDHDDALLTDALGKAWREFPKFFPALGELADFVSRVAKQRVSVSAVKRLPEVSSAPGEMTPEVRAAIASIKSL